MTANKKRLLINLFLFMIVGGLLWFVLTQEPKRGDAPKTLFDQSMGDDITKVVINVKDQDELHLENSTGKIEQEGKQQSKPQWMITKPIKAQADKDKVRLLFTLLTDPVTSSYDVKGKDLANFGLDKDDLSISFNGVKLILGKMNPISHNRYVLKGDKIYLINETVSGLLMQGVDGFKKSDEVIQASEEKTE